MTINPKAESHYNRALELRKSFDETAMLEEISKAVAIEERPEYYLEQAWALLCLKRVEEASKCLDLVDKLKVEKPSARVSEDELTALRKEKESQQSRLNQKQKLKNMEEDSYQEALAHQQAGRAYEAMESIKRAIDRERKPKYCMILAWACLRVGYLDDAAKYLNLISPSDPEIEADEYAELKALLSKFRGKQKGQENLIANAVEAGDPTAVVSAILPAKAAKDLILFSQRLLFGSDHPELGNTKLGGLPNLPAGMKWPYSKKKTPLSFLCQLNLGESDQTMDWTLPKSGMLYFFYDAKEQPWGFDPADRGHWQVIYSPDASNLQELEEEPEDLDAEFVFGEKELYFEVEQTMPDRKEPCFYDADASVETFEAYEKALEEWYGSMPYHRLFGQPQMIQNPMQMECELASKGFDASKQHEGAKFVKMEKTARKNWILLLQIDSEDSGGMMWGDGGRLYFWIRRDELAKPNFENVWVVLQCY